ncbi:chemotaxis protein CheC [Acidovorax sp. A1169]|uniref:chemotaxis protein CheC n=1 Tax=Acidovorax sp. A1169 TaxID=3059524 RepID=UPI002737BE61|nr:chemotaxis protein CheC [Acidovorax sp. A1169]MDP4078601.1 chemotaxis protein CheC [Acidovorax sp. A1169]
MTAKLDAEQIDALSEIFNIGVGKAAAAMGKLMHDEVLLSVPHVSIFTVSEAAQQLGTAGSTMYGVRQPFRGVFSGDALLIFPGDKSLEIVRIVAGQSVPGEDLSAIEQDAMTELGNVMLSSCLATLADLLGNEFELSPPRVDVGDSRTILGTRIQNHLVVFLHIRFELLSSQIEGFVVFVLNTTSLLALRAAVDRLLGRQAEVD